MGVRKEKWGVVTGGPAEMRSAVADPEASGRDGRVQFGDPSFAASYAAAYQGSGPGGRYFSSRLHAVFEILERCPGGDLLDVGCGPGMFVRRVLDTRPGDFRITAVDQAPTMIAEIAGRTAGAEVELAVGEAEALPFPDASFDVVVAMGVLEYCDPSVVLRELERVVRPDGLVLVSMLNPLSPYRLFEWGCIGRYFGCLARSRVCSAYPGAKARCAEVRNPGALGWAIAAADAGSRALSRRRRPLRPDTLRPAIRSVRVPVDASARTTGRHRQSESLPLAGDGLPDCRHPLSMMVAALAEVARRGFHWTMRTAQPESPLVSGAGVGDRWRTRPGRGGCATGPGSGTTASEGVSEPAMGVPFARRARMTCDTRGSYETLRPRYQSGCIDIATS